MIPLHAHSCYSFLRSGSTIGELLDASERFGFPAVALTDHDGLHGAIRFYREALSRGILPILGSEITLKEGEHLTLLAKDLIGYQNLCQLLTSNIKHPDGMAMERIAEFSPGLIALSGCASGRIPQALLRGDEVGARRQAHWFAEVFPNRFWLELQHHGLPHDNALVASLLALSRKTGIPVVATPNSHYTEHEDRIVYEILASIRTQTSHKQIHPEKHLQGEFHFLSREEMAHKFRESPESLANSDRIAESCHLELDLGKPIFPEFPTPSDVAPSFYLRDLCYRGAKKRYGTISEAIRDRLEHELNTIEEVGYTEYFLIVWDISREARARGIRAVSRGSASDSLICYVLGISHVCPMKYGLYFERFLNKERIKKSGLADIDLDIQWDRRDELVQYVYEKYGAEHTAIIGSINTFHTRSAVADIGKVLGLSEGEVRRLARQSHHLAKDKEPWKSVFELAERIEGFPRHIGMHPCGVVISRGRLDRSVPLETSAKGLVITQYEMDDVEQLGLVKMDLLGQAGLTVIADTIDAVERNHGVVLNAYELPPNDEPTWGLIANGESRACFQIESPAMCNLLRRLACKDMECLIAALSLIRPGAANQNKVEHYARRHAGLEEPQYVHPSVRSVLKDTYGLMVYEEHILMVAHRFAGMDLGRADLLRRALSKQSDRDKALEYEKEFRELANKTGRKPAEIERVWQSIMDFCGYSFNKAHSSSYAILAYQSAYLKVHFPVEFMAAVLASGRGFYSRLTYVLEARRLGIDVDPPDVNFPEQTFIARDGKVKTPLWQIKGLTQKTMERILASRQSKEFIDLQDFVMRVRPRASELESLIQCGACDSLGANRPSLLWNMRMMNMDIEDEGEDLFALSGTTVSLESSSNDGKIVPDYSVSEKARREMELLGFPTSAHPVQIYLTDLELKDYLPASSLDGLASQSSVRLCGIVAAARWHGTRGGKPMSFFTLSDPTGMAEVVLFPEVHREFGRQAAMESVVEVTGRVQTDERGRGATVIASKVTRIS